MKVLCKCNVCEEEFIRDASSKRPFHICDGCLLREAKERFIITLTKSLKLDVFIEWLNRKISK